jgi:aminoglycoside 6'-N-acetyltransferase
MDDDRAEPTVLHSARLTLRRGRPGDESALADVFGCDGVRRWWGSEPGRDLATMVADGDPEVTVLMIERQGSVIGLIQYHQEDDPMYRHAGIDLAIHDAHQGNGYGPEAIRLVVDHLAELGHHRIVIDPNAANRPAIVAYERVGFRAVGVMRDYEWSEHEGRWTDGLLMELLIRDLPPPTARR